MFAQFTKLCQLERRADKLVAVQIAASALYPAMLALIADGEVQPTLADEDSRKHYLRLLKQARKQPAAIAAAQTPYRDTLAWSLQQRKARGQILELARLWFTAQLHEAIDGSAQIALHITCDYVDCDNCGGTGQVTAGKQEITCPVCKGAQRVKVPSPWRI